MDTVEISRNIWSRDLTSLDLTVSELPREPTFLKEDTYGDVNAKPRREQLNRISNIYREVANVEGTSCELDV